MLGVARGLHLPRRRDARGDLGRAFGRRRQYEVGGADRRRPRHGGRSGRAAAPRPWPDNRRRSAARGEQASAGSPRWPQRHGFIAATSCTRAGKGDMGIGARDADRAGLERLAQRIEHRALEFGQFVEEQHAEMREADLARPHLQPAADQRRHRRAEWCGARKGRGAHQPAVLQLAGDRWRSSTLRAPRPASSVGQDARQAGGEQRFARARRPDHQQIVAARRRDLQRALGGLLALHLREVGAAAGRLGLARPRRREQLRCP